MWSTVRVKQPSCYKKQSGEFFCLRWGGFYNNVLISQSLMLSMEEMIKDQTLPPEILCENKVIKQLSRP